MELVEKKEIIRIGVLNKKLGIRNSRQLFDGNIAAYGWKDYAHFSALLIAEGILKQKREE